MWIGIPAVLMATLSSVWWTSVWMYFLKWGSSIARIATREGRIVTGAK